MSSIYNPYHITPPSAPAADGPTTSQTEDTINAPREPSYEGDTEEVEHKGRTVLLEAVYSVLQDKLVWRVKANYSNAASKGEGVSAGISAASREREGAADRAANQHLAELKSADAALDLEEQKRWHDLEAAYKQDDLAERKRASMALQEIQNKRLELDTATQKWLEEYQKQGLAISEHAGRVSEAAVTGYFRPSAQTPFSRPVSGTAQAAAAPGAAVATLPREQWETGQQNAPQAAVATRAAPQQGQQNAPQQDTKNMTLDELAQQLKTEQAAPPPPNEQPPQGGQVKKRTVTEVFS